MSCLNQNKLKSCLFFFSLALQFSFVYGEDRDELIITKHCFAKAINLGNLEPMPFQSNCNDPNPEIKVKQGKPVYLWVLVRANEDVLEKLRKDQKLPILHQWKRVVGPFLNEDSYSIVDKISLLIGSGKNDEVDALFDKLSLEVHNKKNPGYFDWRTWSYKQGGLRRGQHWWVSITYNDDTPVICIEKDGTKKPCEYQFLIK